METPVRETIKAVLKAKNVSVNALSRGNATLQRRLQRQINEGSTITEDTIAIILRQFPDVNAEWLLTGEGEMLNPVSNASEVGGVYSASARDDAAAVVPFIPVSAHASFLETFESSAEADFECMPIIPLKEERQNIGQYKIFEVEGDSMFPTISDGSLILVKEIPESRWHYAEGVVVAVYAEYVVVKRILRNNLLTGDTLILGSDNEKYGQMTVQLSDLRALFKAKRIISSYIY